MAFNDQEAPENKLIVDGTDHRGEYYQEDVSWLHDVGISSNDDGIPGVLDGTIAGDAWEVVSLWNKDDKVQSILSGVGVGTAVSDAFVDPFGFAGDQIAGWIMTHVEPLRKVQDELAGNPGMVEAYAASWMEISKELTTMSSNWKSSVEQDIDDWTGQAGDAYRLRAKNLIDQISGAGSVAAGLSTTMETTSKIIDAFRTLVQDILTSLAGALIGYTIELAVTVGIGAPHVVAAIMARLARDTAQMSVLLTKLATTILDVGALSGALRSVVEAILSHGQEEEQPAA